MEKEKDEMKKVIKHFQKVALKIGTERKMLKEEIDRL